MLLSARCIIAQEIKKKIKIKKIINFSLGKLAMSSILPLPISPSHLLLLQRLWIILLPLPSSYLFFNRLPFVSTPLRRQRDSRLTVSTFSLWPSPTLTDVRLGSKPDLTAGQKLEPAEHGSQERVHLWNTLAQSTAAACSLTKPRSHSGSTPARQGVFLEEGPS